MEHGYQFEVIGELIDFDFQNFTSVSDFENFTQPIYFVDPALTHKVIKVVLLDQLVLLGPAVLKLLLK